MQLFVLTGDSGSGKTTWIERLLGSLHGLCMDVAGVYTPAVFEGAAKTGIDAVLLPNGQRLALAVQRAGSCKTGVGDITADETPHAGQPKMRWDFNTAAMERINAHLAGCTACDLFVIDELGPLELLGDEGYTQALALLDAGAPPAALIVVRPSLLDVARKRWGAFTELTPASSQSGLLADIPRVR